MMEESSNVMLNGEPGKVSGRKQYLNQDLKYQERPTVFNTGRRSDRLQEQHMQRPWGEMDLN